jgi:uncharacterized protein DUF4159
MKRRGRRLTWTLAAIIGVVGATVATGYAQRIWAGFYGRTPPKFPTATTFDGNFHFCRVMFASDHREKQGWSTDYPGADINLSVRLSELTKVRVTLTRDLEGGEGEVPDTVVVRLTDDALFQCPFTLMEDAGTARFSDSEVERLRGYLLKGGFLFVSDYHDHPLWHTMFGVSRLPQMASIQTWRRTGGSTIERWNVEGAPPDASGIVDSHGRLMVVMVHNSDIPDPWEREGEDTDYFYKFSPDAYAVGIDIVLYALTH